MNIADPIFVKWAMQVNRWLMKCGNYVEGIEKGGEQIFE
jgi:hypothetical protein